VQRFRTDQAGQWHEGSVFTAPACPVAGQEADGGEFRRAVPAQALLPSGFAGIVRPPAPSQSVRGSFTLDLTIPYSSASIGVAIVLIKPAQQAVAGKKTT